MLKNKKKLLYILVLASVLFHLLIPLSVFAYEIKNARQKVKAGLLPKFCLCAGYPPPFCSKENQEMYIQKYGHVFTHIHHYCWGLDKLNIALQSAKLKESRLEDVISEFDYVLKLSDAKKKMHPGIWTKKAQVLLMLNRNNEAVKSLYNAIKSNKNYIPAYIILSQYLKSTGDHSGACRILKFGIKNNPNSDKLKQLSATCQSR